MLDNPSTTQKGEEGNKKQNGENPEKPITIKFNNEYAHSHRTEQERHHAEQNRQYAIQRSLRNWTCGAMIVGAVYALITLCIWRTNKRASDAAKSAADTASSQLKSFQEVEGAHLGVGQPRGNIQGGEIGIPIENYGHIPSTRAWVYPHIDRFIPARNGNPTKILYSKDYTFFGDQTQIPPGSRSDVRYGVTIPLELKPGELESLRAGDEQLWIGISIKYDDGFGNMSQPGICFSWNRAHPAIWDACPVTSFAEMQKARP